MYIKAHSLRLNEHSAATVDEYCQAKGRNIHFKDYQYTQLVDALKVLFVDVVAADWALTYPWDDMKLQARPLEASHPTIARGPLVGVSAGHVVSIGVESAQAGSVSAEIMSVFSDVFDAVISEIRTRHYSIRTEQSYTGWLVRFIVFHNRQHPETLGETEIAAYLTHLTVNRLVSASTQHQALNAIIFLYKQIYKNILPGHPP